MGTIPNALCELLLNLCLGCDAPMRERLVGGLCDDCPIRAAVIEAYELGKEKDNAAN